MLPLAWGSLTDQDLSEINSAIELLLRAPARHVRLRRLEAAMAVASILSTGRPIAHLKQVRRPSEAFPPLSPADRPALVVSSDKLAWYLRSARPPVPRGLSETPQDFADLRTEFVGVEVTDQVRRLAEILLKRRPRSDRWFVSSETRLREEIEHILRHRRCGFTPLGLAPLFSGRHSHCEEHPRRASCTVEALERRPLRAIAHDAAGDLGLAVAVTAAREPLARTISYYCNISGNKARSVARKVLWPRPSSGAEPFPFSFDFGDRTGGSFTPKDSAVKCLSAAIRTRITETGDDPVLQHGAITDYTVAMLAFALGLRGGSAALPSAMAADEAFGFCVIHDKHVDTPDQARLSWLAPSVQEHLVAYEAHLREMIRQLPPRAAFQVKKTRENAPHELVLFDMTPDAVRFLKPHEVLDRLKGYGWSLPRNAGRHWLRSKLLGKCSSETLQAFFGHWQIGTHPWLGSSCLDPQLYRADLKRALPAVLSEVDWVPLEIAGSCSSRLESLRPIPFTRKAKPSTPFRKTLGLEVRLPVSLGNADKFTAKHGSPDPEFRMGQLIFSAVLNGGLLNQADWPAFISGVQQYEPQNEWAHVELHDPMGTGAKPARRWFPDPVTRPLLDHWHNSPPWALSGDETDPIRCLNAFFGYKQVGGHVRHAVDDLLQFAEAKWSLRLPPLLLSYAQGAVRSASVPEVSWARLLQRPRRPVQFVGTPPKANYFDQLRSILPQEHAALSGPWNDYREGRINLLRAKRLAAARIRRLHAAGFAGPRATLAKWCIALLLARRKRPWRTGYALTTLQDYLSRIAFELYPEDLKSPDVKITHADLERRLKSARSRIENESDCKKLENAARLLALFLNASPVDLHTVDKLKSNGIFIREARDPAAAADAREFEDWQGDQPNSGFVYANLVAPAEFQRALRECLASGEEDLAIALVLGFRAGLRMPEIAGLRTSDFQQCGAKFDLFVQRHERRELKTFQSRRIVPLDVLLPVAEVELIARRLDTLNAQSTGTRSPFLLGPPGAHKICSAAKLEESAATFLRQHCDAKDVVFHHLRHSFASYLLATLLLPSSLPADAIPEVFSEAISPDRKSQIQDRLLGAERLGQSALHAVSQLVGHAGVNMTTSTYAHLLDLSLWLFVSRDPLLSRHALDHKGKRHPNDDEVISSADISTLRYRIPPLAYPSLAFHRRWFHDARRTNEPPALNGRRRAISDAISSSARNVEGTARLHWRTIHHLLSGADETRRLDIMRTFALSSLQVQTMKRSYELMLKNCVKQKAGGTSLPLPQGPDAINLADTIWTGLNGRIAPDLLHSVAEYLAGYDVKRSIARFRSASEASVMREKLILCGLLSTDVIVVSSAEYRERQVELSARHETHGTLSTYWSAGSFEIDHVQSELLRGERLHGPVSSVLCLMVGTQWPSRRYVGGVDLKRRRPTPVRQLNYAVRFAILLFAVAHDLHRNKRSSQST